MGGPPAPWTILAILRWTSDYFRTNEVSEPRASAEVLLAHTLGLSRLDLYLRYDQPLNPDELSRFKALVVRRRAGEPVAYLTGHREFWSLDFRVTPAVLIPRPETEVLVAAALEAARDFEEKVIGGGGQGLSQAGRPEPPAPPPIPYGEDVGAGLKPAPTIEIKVAPQDQDQKIKGPLAASQPKTENRKSKTLSLVGLEVGVGSGAVVIALAKELPRMTWVGLDFSGPALAVAQDNVRRHEVAERVHFLQADLLTAFKPRAALALLVANLPYVPRAEWERLPREIKAFEPQAALLGGEDGLDLLRPFIRQAHPYVQPGGWVLLEVGDQQAPAVAALFSATGAYDRIETIPDFCGIPRVVRARRLKGSQ
jgi:release factor glutamine methyltransferase